MAKTVTKTSTWGKRQNGKFGRLSQTKKVSRYNKKPSLKALAGSIKDDKLKAELINQLAKQETKRMAFTEGAATGAQATATIGSNAKTAQTQTQISKGIEQNIDGGIQNSQSGRDEDEDYGGAI